MVSHLCALSHRVKELDKSQQASLGMSTEAQGLAIVLFRPKPRSKLKCGTTEDSRSLAPWEGISWKLTEPPLVLLTGP